MLKQKVFTYLEANDDELDFENIRTVYEYFIIFKDMFKNHTVMKKVGKKESNHPDHNQREGLQNDSHIIEEEGKDREMVGDIDQEGGFGLGKADPNSKPKENFYSSPTKSEKGLGETRTRFINNDSPDNTKNLGSTAYKIPDKQTAFTE